MSPNESTMSWNVLLFNFGGPPPREGLREGCEPPPMGDAREVRDAISAVIPDVDWSDPGWGILDGDGWSIEFTLGNAGRTTQMMLLVKGGGDPIPTIVAICKANNWSAYDMFEDEFMDLNSPSSRGWTGFQTFREQIRQKEGRLRRLRD